MRKKFLAILMAALTLSATMPVYAASELPIAKSNSYTVSKDGGGSYEYTVPYTANYEITLAGAQGSSYSSNAGGYGYTLKKTIRLQYGDTIKVELPNRKNYYTEGTTIKVPGGDPAKLYINGTLVQVAGGGGGTVSNQTAPNDIYYVQTQNGAGTNTATWNSSVTVHWHTGNGVNDVNKANHSNNFPTVYLASSPGGCYAGDGHTHNAVVYCPRHTCVASSSISTYRLSLEGCPTCGSCNTETWTRTTITHSECGYSAWEESAHCNTCGGSKSRSWSNGRSCPGTIWDCGSPVNTWTVQCGIAQGYVSASNGCAGTCKDGSWSASLNNSGNAKFTIKLAEQNGVQYKNVVASTAYYLNDPVDLIVCDNTVTYYKRR
ncbi:MAG: hypothetical protein NC548_45395 [Lachnospiraceae bacterium]|nr:hypothetical protein [Lachnospiraceae bacterium]